MRVCLQRVFRNVVAAEYLESYISYLLQKATDWSIDTYLSTSTYFICRQSTFYNLFKSFKSLSKQYHADIPQFIQLKNQSFIHFSNPQCFLAKSQDNKVSIDTLHPISLSFPTCQCKSTCSK